MHAWHKEQWLVVSAVAGWLAQYGRVPVYPLCFSEWVRGWQALALSRCQEKVVLPRVVRSCPILWLSRRSWLLQLVNMEHSSSSNLFQTLVMLNAGDLRAATGAHALCVQVTSLAVLGCVDVSSVFYVWVSPKC